MAIEFGDLRQKVNEFVDRVADQTFGISVAAAEFAEAEVKGRIFSPNGVKDVDGNDLGGYVGAADPDNPKGYAKRRRRAGRQVNKKDFNVTGDLQLAISVGVDAGSGTATVGFTNERAATIADGLENQGAVGRGERGRKEIFSLSTTETASVQNQIENLIVNVVEREALRVFGR